MAKKRKNETKMEQHAVENKMELPVVENKVEPVWVRHNARGHYEYDGPFKSVTQAETHISNCSYRSHNIQHAVVTDSEKNAGMRVTVVNSILEEEIDTDKLDISEAITELMEEEEIEYSEKEAEEE